LLLLLTLALTPAWAEQQADSVLGVETVAGTATVEHLGVTRKLQPGDRLNERDVIHTGADGRLSLRFARLGFFEVGPNAEIGVEKLPFASYAADLKSIFSLSHGYLRVVWKHLPTGTSWPLYVYFGGQRAGLGAGEYFFDQTESGTRVCVAAGQIAVVPVTGEAVETLRPPSCTRLFTGVTPDSQTRDPEDWIAVRREFSIDATARSPDTTASRAPAIGPPPPPSPTVAAAAPVAADSPPPDLVPAASSSRGVDAASVNPRRRSTTPAAAAAENAVPSPLAMPVAAPPTVAAGAVSPAPPPAVPASPGEAGWTVNVASYADNDAATRQLQQLRAAGYGASVQPVEIKGRTWYRVQLRGFATADAARAKAGELQTKLGYANLWVIRQP
jgi:hypothetical protein